MPRPVRVRLGSRPGFGRQATTTRSRSADRCAGPVGSAVSCHLRGHRWSCGRFGRACRGWMDALEVGVVARAPGVWIAVPGPSARPCPVIFEGIVGCAAGSAGRGAAGWMLWKWEWSAVLRGCGRSGRGNRSWGRFPRPERGDRVLDRVVVARRPKVGREAMTARPDHSVGRTPSLQEHRWVCGRFGRTCRRSQPSDRASSHAWRVANTMRRAANASPRIRTSGCRCLSSRYRPSLPMPPHASTTLSNPSSTDRRPL